MRLAGRRIRAFRQLRSSSLLQLRRVPPSELLEDRTLLTSLLGDAFVLTGSASSANPESLAASSETTQSPVESSGDGVVPEIGVAGVDSSEAASAAGSSEPNGASDGQSVGLDSEKLSQNGLAVANSGPDSVGNDVLASEWLVGGRETLPDVALSDNVFTLRTLNRATDLQTLLLDRFAAGTGLARSAFLTGELVTTRLRALLLSGRAAHDGSEGGAVASGTPAGLPATGSASSNQPAGQVSAASAASDVPGDRPSDPRTSGPREGGQPLTQRLTADIVSEVLEGEHLSSTAAGQAETESSRAELLALAESPVENSSGIPLSHSLQLASGQDTGFSSVEVDFTSDLQAAIQPLVMLAGTMSAAMQSIAATLSFVLRGDWGSAGSLAPHAEFVEPLLNPGLAAADQWTRRSSALSDDGSWVDAVVLVPQTDRPFDIRDFGRLQLEGTVGLPVEFPVADSAQNASASGHASSTESETTSRDTETPGTSAQADTVTALRVERRPLHGRLSSSVQSGIEYLPDPGFHGIDSAVVRVFGEAGRSARVLIVFEATESTDVVFRQPDRLFDELVQQSRP